LQRDNALKLFAAYDVIIDGTDNFATRYLVNDACVLLSKPNVYGSIFRFDGQASVFYPGRGPCYRCLYPEPPPPGEVPSCAEGGVLGILPGLIGCIQATECVKLLLGQGSPLVGRLLLYDALQMSFREFKVRRNPKCPICGDQPTIRELIDYDQFCGVRGQEAPAPAAAADGDISVEELKQRLDRREEVFILDVRNPEEFQLCRIPGSTLLPLSALAQRLAELDPEREMVVHCKSGMRSQKAIAFLRQQGYRKLRNLTGGILAWADRIDPTMPKY
jgi:adenylyltransferase/sulfurtransferase